MKNRILIFGILVCLVSCKSQVTEENKNALIGDKAKIWYVAGLDNPNIPSEWLQGLDLNKLMVTTFTPVLKGEIDVYNPNLEYFVNELNYDELKELFFHETWYATPNLKSFDKEVEFWCPVRVWNRNGQTLKRKCFYVRPASKHRGIMIGKSVFTEFSFKLPNGFPIWYGFDPQKYINSVLDNIQNNKLKAYDPVYIVDKSLKTLSPEELEKYIGESLNSEDLRNNIGSFIFEEDWFIDPQTLDFQKEVKSIGFVKKYWDKNWPVLFFVALHFKQFLGKKCPIVAENTN